MQYDGLLTIATGSSRRCTNWKNKRILWSDLAAKLSNVTRTQETQAEYERMPKDERDRIKDVGGFVGGSLRTNRRKADSVCERQLITLDLDNVPQDTDPWPTVTLALGCAAVLYSTHSHTPRSPNQLCAIFNYAVKYYGLKENPCHKAGSIGRKNAKEMQFWTKDEYIRFAAAIEDKPQMHSAFQVLYWCGIREGELLALTKDDIDFEGNTITINKSYQRIGKKDIITEPKTPKSNRIIALPNFLCEELKEYISHIYDNGRIFPLTKHALYREMIRGSSQSGVKKIRVHDLRHSHASLLIELGFSPLLIAERLGHENIETTLNTYSHLYPHKQGELAQTLDSLLKT